MTLTLERPLVADYSYHLLPYPSGSGSPDTVSQCLPEDMELEDRVSLTLGATAWGRLQYFCTYYRGPWGERAHCKPLSPRSVQGLGRFLRLCGEVVTTLPRRPSLFLSDDGCLELVWEDRDGQTVQLQFGSSAISYFLERSLTEGQVTYQPDRLRALASDLPQ